MTSSVPAWPKQLPLNCAPCLSVLLTEVFQNDLKAAVLNQGKRFDKTNELTWRDWNQEHVVPSEAILDKEITFTILAPWILSQNSSVCAQHIFSMFGKSSYYQGQKNPRGWNQLLAMALGRAAVMDVLGDALGVLLGLAPALRDAAVFFWLLDLPWPWNCTLPIYNVIHFHLLFSAIISSLWGSPCWEGGPITGKRQEMLWVYCW